MGKGIFSARGFISMFVMALALLVAACDGGTVTVVTTGSSSSSSSGSGSGGSSSTSPSTSPSVNCATLLPGGTASGTPAMTPFGDAPLPGNSSVAPATTYLDGGSNLWSVYLDQACTDGASASAVYAFFASQYPSAGWPQVSKLPFDGGYFAPCGDAYCWGKGTPQRFVGLEHVVDHGGATTYQLRLFLPPPVPACGSSFAHPEPPGFQPFLGVFTYYVALPPLSLLLPNDAAGGQKGEDICSAGTVSSIITFMQTELPKQGFSHLSGSGGDQTWQQGGKTIHWSISDPHGWEIDWRVPLPMA